jgi:protein O-GlcNAc transferase
VPNPMSTDGPSPRVNGRQTRDALGVARRFMHEGNREMAVRTLVEAVNGEGDPEVAFTLGVWALEDGKPNDARTHFRTAASLAPAVPEVFINLAAAAGRLRCHDEALDAARRAVTLAETSEHAYGALGNALSGANRFAEAQAAYLEAHKRGPASPTWMLTLGQSHLALGDSGGAEQWFARALEARPDSGTALHGLGLCAQSQGDHAAAIGLFERALALDDRYAEAWGNLAISLQSNGRHHDALEAARHSLDLNPHVADALLNLGHILQSVGRHGEAIDAYEQALGIEPELPGARAYLLHSKRHTCRWEGDSELVKVIVDEVLHGAQVAPFTLAGTDAPPAIRLIAARRSAAAHARGLPPMQATVPPLPDKACLRIGFVSPDFRTHSLAMSFSAVLEARDDRSIDWIGYSIGDDAADGQTGGLATSFDAFVDLSALSDDAAAARIQADGVDVLVDLAGHTRGSRLEIFARQPAAVQAHYLGYGGTIGADYIPWLITDRVHTPPSLADHCSEALAYLPHTFMAAAHVAQDCAIPDRESVGLPPDGIVFACFNATYKLEPTSFASWMRILAGVPGSVLWLRGTTAEVADRLRTVAAKQGVDRNRLIFADRLDRSAHLARHALADIALDSFNHTGGVTTIDALLVGVPVITIAGTNQSARTGASILSALGTPALIQTGVDDYEELATALALDPQRLAAAKADVAQRVATSPLFDPTQLARALNTAFREMHRAAARGAKPSTFDVRKTGSAGI